jgi:hypothetical protein
VDVCNNDQQEKSWCGFHPLRIFLVYEIKTKESHIALKKPYHNQNTILATLWLVSALPEVARKSKQCGQHVCVPTQLKRQESPHKARERERGWSGFYAQEKKGAFPALLDAILPANAHAVTVVLCAHV